LLEEESPAGFSGDFSGDFSAGFSLEALERESVR
jgi:hypothetical protein